MSIDPTYYRNKAHETSQLASRIKHPETRDYLLQVAEQYENLATEAEAKLMRPVTLATA